eukprot:1146717-Pelagomonas_calceolata.AAC.5
MLQAKEAEATHDRMRLLRSKSMVMVLTSVVEHLCSTAILGGQVAHYRGWHTAEGKASIYDSKQDSWDHPSRFVKQTSSPPPPSF